MSIKRFVIALPTVFIFIAITLFIYFQHFIRSALSTESKFVTYILTKGTPVKIMLKQMKSQHIVSPLQARFLGWWIKFKGSQAQLQAGEYLFPLNITPQNLLDKMIKGDVVQYAMTFSEGITFQELLQLVHNHPVITQTVKDKDPQEIMRLLGAPNSHAEGLFFPDTYYFVLGTTDLELLNRAYKTMQTRLATVFEQKAANCVIKTPYEALILASIIEKEAAMDNERAIISGVFQRRLAKQMLLQADPTVVYGVKDTFKGSLTTAELRRDTPYNTYVHKGLPPTPIAMPGLKAIYAACHPQEGQWLYFVAKGDGSHYFSQNLPEHNKAVAQFQLKDRGKNAK